MVRGWAQELGGFGITVNAIGPGVIETPLARMLAGDQVSHGDHVRCFHEGDDVESAGDDVHSRHSRHSPEGGGHIPGFAEHKHRMSAAEYVDKVAKGELYDATLSFQLDNGFEVRGVLADYLEEPAIDNWAALIVWENPDYRR